MFKKGGWRPFFVGITATIGRDVVFGGTYAFLRHDLHQRWYLPLALAKGIPLDSAEDRWAHFKCNVIAACVATILSSPLNYVRTIHYTTPPDVSPLSISTTLKHLYVDVKEKATFSKQVQFLVLRLAVGWGTARVAAGMAIGSEFYYYCSTSSQ